MLKLCLISSCLLVGLSSAAPQTSWVNMRELCSGITSYFNVLAKDAKLEAVVHSQLGGEDEDMKVHLDATADISGICRLEHKDNIFSLDVPLQDALTIEYNGEMYSVRQCSIKLSFLVIRSNNVLKVQVIKADIRAFEGVKRGNVDFTGLELYLMRNNLEEAFGNYAKRNLAFIIDLQKEKNLAEEAITLMLKTSLAKLVRKYSTSGQI